MVHRILGVALLVAPGAAIWELAININPNDGHDFGYGNWPRGYSYGTAEESLSRDFSSGNEVWGTTYPNIAITRHDGTTCSAARVWRLTTPMSMNGIFGAAVLNGNMRRTTITSGGPIFEASATTGTRTNGFYDPIFSVGDDLVVNFWHSNNGARIAMNRPEQAGGMPLSAQCTGCNTDDLHGLGNEFGAGTSAGAGSSSWWHDASVIQPDCHGSSCHIQGTDHGSAWGSRVGPTLGSYAVWIGNGETIGCNAADAATSSGDPHLALPHGGKADFRGEHKALFNFLSARNLSLNVMTEMADFELHEANHSRHKDVHGSFLTQAHIVARTSSGKTVRVSFWAGMIKEAWNNIGEPLNMGWANGTVDSESFVLAPGGVRRASVQDKQVDNVKLHMSYSSLHVVTPEFEIVVTPHAFRLERNVVGLHHRLDVQIKPRVAEAAFKVAPHGIVGQAWDGDGKAIDGEQDAFPKSGEFTTYSMAKGAIEGGPSDYKILTPYATDFKYSRFDATSAQPRAVAKLVAAGVLNAPKVVFDGDTVGSTELTEQHM